MPPVRVAAPSVHFVQSTRVLLAAAPTTPPCFRRWRRSSLLPNRGGLGKTGKLYAMPRAPLLAGAGTRSVTGGFSKENTMPLENKLGLTDEAALARAEEKISKTKALELYDTGLLDAFPVGTFAGLQKIHGYLFGEIYPFAGQMRTVNIAKGNFRFAPVMYLAPALESIDAMPQSTFDEIIEKYVEMNVAHPFREGNGRSTRIWLDCILKKELHQVIDWSRVDKSDYLLAMERSPVKDVEIKALLRAALTDRITDRLVYMKGIDASYHYEGYHVFRTEDL